jgi:hypothetical protein
MAEDRSLYVHAQVEPGLAPSLPIVGERTLQNFAALAEYIQNPSHTSPSVGLDAAIGALDGDLAKLRAQRATAPFALDRMLPFWALVFNLKEIARDLKELESTLPQLTGAAAGPT